MTKGKGFVFRNAQILKFLLVGGIAVAIDAISYALLVDQAEIAHGISKRISFVLGSIWAFWANKYFTFESPVPPTKEILLFSVLYLSTFLANGWMHDFVFEASALDWLSFLVATATSTTINFLGQKFVVFRKPK